MTSDILKVSIITVVHDAAGDFVKTADSVLGQTYPHIEYIIIDGGSTDGTVEVIKRYSGRISYWISEPDNGIYDAMNKGIKQASGEWILFMNAGDVFTDTQVLSHIFLNDHESEEIIYGDSIADYSQFMVLHKALPLSDLFKGMPFSHQAMLTKSGLLKTRCFSSSYSIAADYDLVYRLFREHKKFLYIPRPFCIFTVSGVSNQRYLRSLKEMYRINKKYGKNNAGVLLHFGKLLVAVIFAKTGYAVIPRKMMLWIVKFMNRRNVIGTKC